MGKAWTIKDAENNFEDMLELCDRDGPQIIKQPGDESTALISFSEWNRLQKGDRVSLKDLLLSDHPRANFELMPRGYGRHRSFGTDEEISYGT